MGSLVQLILYRRRKHVRAKESTFSRDFAVKLLLISVIRDQKERGFGPRVKPQSESLRKRGFLFNRAASIITKRQTKSFVRVIYRSVVPDRITACDSAVCHRFENLEISELQPAEIIS